MKMKTMMAVATLAMAYIGSRKAARRKEKAEQ